MRTRRSGWNLAGFRAVAVAAGFALLCLGLSGVALADERVPEFDGGTMASALTLLSGGLLIITGGRVRK
jgi:hypothetical protein